MVWQDSKKEEEDGSGAWNKWGAAKEENTAWGAGVEKKEAWSNSWNKREDSAWNAAGQKRPGDWGDGDTKRPKGEEGVQRMPQPPSAYPAHMDPGTPPQLRLHQTTVPSTPRDALFAGSAPKTPMDVLRGSTPGTPNFQYGRLGPPGTPGGRIVPGTPGGANPATPAGVNPATPAGRAPGTPTANPATPAGRAPGTPVAPGTPGQMALRPMMGAPPGARSAVQHGGFGSGLSTPNAFAQRGPPQPVQPEPPRQVKLKMTVWADGTPIQLRHAPRRDKGAKQLPAPLMPAHWDGRVLPVGQDPPQPRLEVPDFSTWRRGRLRQREARVVGHTRADETPVPTQPRTAVPPEGTPADFPPPGEATPFMPRAGELTPFAPRDRGAGPGGDEGTTPYMPPAGDATPYLPRAGDGRPGAEETPPARLPGEVTPYAGVARGAAKVQGEETPLEAQAIAVAAALSSEGDGGITPYLAGETPRASGEATPFLPPRAAFPGVTPGPVGEETPPVGGVVQVPGDGTPLAREPWLGFEKEEVADLADMLATAAP